MLSWFKRFLPQNPMTYDEDMRVILPGLDIAISHSVKVVWMIDQTGTQDEYALSELEAWVKKQGYFLHCVSVAPAQKDEA